VARGIASERAALGFRGQSVVSSVGERPGIASFSAAPNHGTMPISDGRSRPVGPYKQEVAGSSPAPPIGDEARFARSLFPITVLGRDRFFAQPIQLCTARAAVDPATAPSTRAVPARRVVTSVRLIVPPFVWRLVRCVSCCLTTAHALQ
jgi:hypothetical protein